MLFYMSYKLTCINIRHNGSALEALLIQYLVQDKIKQRVRKRYSNSILIFILRKPIREGKIICSLWQ